MASEAASDCESEGSIVAGSVPESEAEEDERRVQRMLFIHKNAFQLYHTMSDFTSGTEATFGGSSSPVIQLIPKTKCFRLHMENHQQQVKTLAYDETTQSEQSQSLLRSGVTCLAGVSSSERNRSPVTHIDTDHNYSRENWQDADETMLDIDMNNDLPARNNKQEISDEEDSPEINLLTGAVITPSTSARERKVSPTKALSATDCTSPNMPSVFSRHASPLGPFTVSKGELSVMETLISKRMPSEAETAVQPMQGSLSRRTMLLQEETLVAQSNVEQKTKSQAADSELPVDLLRPLSNESITISLTPMNMSPLMDSQVALSDGSTIVELLTERRDALPVELLAALNKMPLMTSVVPVTETLPSPNNNSAIVSTTQANLGLKAGVLALYDSDAQADDDPTQITDIEPHSQPSRKIEFLEQTSIEFSNGKNETEADTSKCKTIDKLAKGQILDTSGICLTTSSQPDNVAGSIILRKSSRKRVATISTCPCCDSSCEKNNFHFNKESTDKKRKAMSPDHEDLSDKLPEHSERERIISTQNSETVFKNNLKPSGLQTTCNELLYNKTIVPTNKIQNPKISNSFIIQPLQGQIQSRQILFHVQDCIKVRNRTTVFLRKDDKKGSKNTANAETECRTISAMNARQSSRAEKENSIRCHAQCQGRSHSNAAKTGGEPILTRSASNSSILKFRKIMNRRNIYGETKLHEAASNGNVNLLRVLIQAGININLPDYAGWTALHEASIKGFYDAVVVVLSAGADVNCKGLNGVTPLQDAVKNGHFQVVQLLMQHGANPFEKNDFGKCALQEAMDSCMKRLIESFQQKGTAGVKVGGNSRIARRTDLKNTVVNKKSEVCRNSKRDALSSNNFNTLSLKRKTESTHQTKSDVQPNKKTQNAATTHNTTENQAKIVNVGQPQRRPTTRCMVKSQIQFADHSEHQITQCYPFNSKPQTADKVEIQTKAASITMKATETKPTSCNFSSQIVVAQTSERRPTRIRNSTCGFFDQAENSPATSKQPSTEASQQNIPTLKHCAAQSQTSMIATLSCQERIVRLTANQLTTPNAEVKLTNKFCTENVLKNMRNKSNVNDTTNGKLDAVETLNASNSSEQFAQLKNYPKRSQQSPNMQASDDFMIKKLTCNINVEMTPKTHDQRGTGNSINENTINNTTLPQNKKKTLPDLVNSTEANKSTEHIPSTEYSSASELTITGEVFQKGEIRQHEPTKNKILEESSDRTVEAFVVSEHRCSHPVISEHESGQKPLAPLTSEHISSQQEANYAAASDSERLDIAIIEYKSSNYVASTGDSSEAVILEPVTPGAKPKGTLTVNDQSNSNAPTCGTVSGHSFNAVTTILHSEPQTCMDEANATTAGLSLNNLNVADHLSMPINMETGKHVNVHEARENIKDSNANNKCRGPAQGTSKNGPAHAMQTGDNDNKRNTLQNTEGMSNVHSTEVNTNVTENKKEKRSSRQRTTKISGSPISNVVIPTYCSAIPKLSALNKKNGKGETRLHLAVMKRDVSSVRSLIAAGIHVNMNDNAGWTALHEACSRGFTDVIQELLKAGADVNCQGVNGVLPLQDAVSGSHYEAVKLLLQYGADPRQKSTGGKSAFDEIADDKIKNLLEDHCNSEMTVHEQPQPITGPSNDNSASCDDEQMPPALPNDKDSESPYYYIRQHESITILLNEMETKQERMMRCKLKEPENAAQFELELSQIQSVLNEVLTKHKAEKEDLVKKFRVSPGSFRQGTLQKQVTALASRQRKFLNLLQKRKTLDQKLQEYNLKLRQIQQNNSVNPAKSLTCTIESSISTDTSSSEGQLSNQWEELSASSGKSCPAHKPECIQKQSCLSQGKTCIAANQDTNRTDALQEYTAGCRNEISDTACVLAGASRDSNICTVSTSKSVSSKAEANSLQPHSSETSHVQMETLSTSQTDRVDSTACSSSGQNIFLNTTQSINNPETNSEINSNYALLNTEKSSANHKEVMDTSLMQTSSNNQNSHFPPAVTQPRITFLPKNSVQSYHIVQPKTLQLKSSHQFIDLPSTLQRGGNQQQILLFNTAAPSGKFQNSRILNVVQPNNQCTMPVNATQDTSNNQDNSLVSASTLSGRQHDSKSLPKDKGNRQRKLLYLSDLITHGLIQPGEDVLGLKLQGACYKADLLASGVIRSKDGAIYHNPAHWIKALLGDQIPVSRKFAWSKVTYREKELLKYNSMIKSSSKAPETRPISQSTTLTDKTSSIPPHRRIFTETSSTTQKEKASSSFMQVQEILLIRNEEFLPCHIMDRHWKFYTECDEWIF
uniref:ankyrin repeat domain-containing protein 31-like n=1 Tax=Pristiophorus japonicus TaxID=55135 RepID=UPI00398F0884